MVRETMFGDPVPGITRRRGGRHCLSRRELGYDKDTRGVFVIGFYDARQIEEADRDRVWGPGRTASPDRTGYGLYVVKTIADAHG
ncbi:HAMP domain-containing histidine kinase [Haloarcula salina]|uniref:Uncharacterized protein n=1 Tax=Haloarcula salina TaxID=1429914 RepID=A0AA41G1W8_9EURY|nr:HAMP domain-containing histidine kinase [Haloarcula salina]MBV0902685.1 hypothetical protein [Haloarcula salina]